MAATREAETIVDLLLARTGSSGKQRAYCDCGGTAERGVSWGRHLDNVRRSCGVLAAQGARRGDRMLLALPSTYKAELIQQAAMALGVVVVFLEPFAKEQQATVAAALEPRWMIIETDGGVSDSRLLLVDVRRGVRLPWDTLYEQALPFAEDFAAAPEAPAMVACSSGTSGAPKLRQFCHRQVVIACRAIAERLPVEPRDAVISWLPLQGLFQRMLNFCSIAWGAETHFIPPPQIAASLPLVKPALLIGVPRFFEKLAARQVTRAMLGDHLRCMLTGSAPCSPAALEYFDRLGVPLLEAYGLTENIIPIAMNTLRARRTGSVGLPLPHHDLAISAAGEVLVRSPGISPDCPIDGTAGARGEGFLHTGDRGYLDPDGFLFLTGRLDEYIKTSAGRKIFLVPLEKHFAGLPGIADVVITGHGRKCPVGILTLRESGRPGRAAGKLDHIAEAIRIRNGLLPLHERVWLWLATCSAFSSAAGELTHNGKLCRPNIEQRYEGRISALLARHDTSGSHERRVVVELV